ncbi:hypothetical protein AB9Q52_011045 [Pantoea vagans]|uniref:hypothetical protein n=1 Tax=Pantoea vagans TaxID=470934 RepID=UPI00351575D2
MSRFTKGPWVADKTSRAVGPVSKEDDQSYGMALAVAWVEFDPEVEIQAANQQLIAAAPELLEALQEMVAIVKKNTYPQPDKPSSTWGRMEAAESVIAKALGQ